MAEQKKLVKELKKLSDSELEKVIAALKKDSEEQAETPVEVVRMSELPEGVEEKTRVIMMDRKMTRKLQSGEEGTQDEIAAREGTLDPDDPEAPGGSTTISGTTITGSQLASAISRDFGPVCTGGAIFLSDGFYFLYWDSEVQKVLSEDLTDLQMWINTYFDCDDFAQVVAGVVNQHLKGSPFGVLWYKGSGVYHAVNCYYSRNQSKMKVVEPQTDGVYNFDKTKYCPMLVVI